MRGIKKRLAELTATILNSGHLSEEEYNSFTAELKTLKELIATHKALATFEEDFGEDGEASESRQKRVSDSTWDG